MAAPGVSKTMKTRGGQKDKYIRQGRCGHYIHCEIISDVDLDEAKADASHRCVAGGEEA
jgi:hypothetical protein